MSHFLYVVCNVVVYDEYFCLCDVQLLRQFAFVSLWTFLRFVYACDWLCLLYITHYTKIQQIMSIMITQNTIT